MRIKTILVSQPKPQNGKSPYFELAEKHNLKIDFRPFIHIEGIDIKEFRQERIDILEHSAVIFTSRTAIDHLFNICKELKITMPADMKYFCVSESIAFYLQKYIVYRKRKIFFGQRTFEDLMPSILKHKKEKFLIPLSDIHKASIPALLTKSKIQFTKAILYRTVSSDLSDLSDINYDILAFYSPSGIASLMQNFPDFKQATTTIAAFGPTTTKAVSDAGLKLNIQAPTPKAPSMTMALDLFIKDFNKKNKDK